MPRRSPHELSRRVEQAIPGVLARGAFQQQVPSRQLLAMIADHDRRPPHRLGLRHPERREAVRAQVDAADLGEHPWRPFAGDREPSVAVGAGTG